MQYVPRGHCLPHAPQFAGSVLILTHFLPHTVGAVGGQTTETHAPFLQTFPPGQTTPQAPQFDASF
jgi:hypothetical protein